MQNPTHACIPIHMQKSCPLGGLIENSSLKHLTSVFTMVPFEHIHDYSLKLSIIFGSRYCFGALEKQAWNSLCVAHKNTHHIPGLRNRVFIMVLWEWREGNRCGSLAHPQQSATCATLLVIYRGLLVKEIARFTLACNNRCSLLATNQWQAAVDRADSGVWSAFSDSFLREWLLSGTVRYWLAFCFLFIVWVSLVFLM